MTQKRGRAGNGKKTKQKGKNITYIEHSGAEWVIAGYTVPPEIFHVIIERRPITEYTKYGKVTCGNLYLGDYFYVCFLVDKFKSFQMFKTEEIFKEALGKAKEEEVKLENIMCSVKECRVCIKKKIQEAGNN